MNEEIIEDTVIDEVITEDIVIDDGIIEDIVIDEELDLSEFNFDDDELEGIAESVRLFKENGLTNEQIKMVINEVAEEEVTDNDKVEILKEELNDEEKRNYQSINKFVTASFGNELEKEDIKELMLNPDAIYLLNILYKAGTSTNTRTKKTISKPTQVDNTDQIEEEMIELYRKSSMSRETRKKAMVKLYNRSTNKEWAKKEFKEYLT